MTCYVLHEESPSETRKLTPGELDEALELMTLGLDVTVVGKRHRCGDNAVDAGDGGWPPYVCLVCGRRLLRGG